jgi:hypothetical protein
MPGRETPGEPGKQPVPQGFHQLLQGGFMSVLRSGGFHGNAVDKLAILTKKYLQSKYTGGYTRAPLFIDKDRRRSYQ